jgi:hypothetical protein
MYNDIIIYISKFINYKEYEKLSRLNNYINQKLLIKIPRYIKLQCIFEKLNIYPQKLLDIFDPFKLYKVPNIKIKIYSGNTEYIDYINSSFFSTYPIIKGIDELNRPYISFYYNNKITTLFQRYTYDKIRWVTGGCSPTGNFVSVIDFDEKLECSDNETIIILSNLLNNNICTYDNITYKLNEII